MLQNFVPLCYELTMPRRGKEGPERPLTLNRRLDRSGQLSLLQHGAALHLKNRNLFERAEHPQEKVREISFPFGSPVFDNVALLSTILLKGP
jgi:hypothetical protein